VLLADYSMVGHTRKRSHGNVRFELLDRNDVIVAEDLRDGVTVGNNVGPFPEIATAMP